MSETLKHREEDARGISTTHVHFGGSLPEGAKPPAGMLSAPLSVPGRVPYCCPVCGGKGTRPADFYTGGTMTTGGLLPVSCKSCLGTGIVWGG